MKQQIFKFKIVFKIILKSIRDDFTVTPNQNLTKTLTMKKFYVFHAQRYGIFFNLQI